MNKKYQNGFFIFGLVVLGIMLTQLDYNEVWQGIQHAGYWFFAVIALWAGLYIFNATAWYIIIRSDGDEVTRKVRLSHIYRLTVSGFALNYATPGGLMGGEPYRIMSLAPLIGTERASSSVILYVMTHIFSHFWFWLVSAVLFLALKPQNAFTVSLMVAVMAFCLAAIWFFLKGYKKGIAFRLTRILGHLPGMKKRAAAFIEKNSERLTTVDQQIAALHGQNPRTFASAVGLELACRIVSSLEIMFIMQVVAADFTFIDSMLTLAFTSLFANMLFFMPLQLGGREGGFLMSTTALGVTASSGIFVALIVRIRELVWTAIGLLLIKIGGSK